MFQIHSNDAEIFLTSDGQRLMSVEKSDVYDFTTHTLAQAGIIDFETNSGERVRFAIPRGDDYEKALHDLIKITDEMGV